MSGHNRRLQSKENKNKNVQFVVIIQSHMLLDTFLLRYYSFFRTLCHENKFALLKVQTSKGQRQILEIIFLKSVTSQHISTKQGI